MIKMKKNDMLAYGALVASIGAYYATNYLRVYYGFFDNWFMIGTDNILGCIVSALVIGIVVAKLLGKR